MSDAASRMYPSMSPTPQEPAKPVAAIPAPESPSTAVTEPARAEPKAVTELAEAPPAEVLTMEQKMYGDSVSTNSNVTWDEDAASHVAHYDLDHVPDDLRNPDTAAYVAGQAQFREGLLAAGAGPSLARELWTDAVRAERTPIRTTMAEASAQLRERWGPRTDSKLAAAHGLLAKAIAKCPEIATALERTGLGNDVNFIVKLSKRAEALAKKGTR